MPTSTEYIYVMDNNGIICTDNAGSLIYVSTVIIVTNDAVIVRKVKNQTYPCNGCKFQHSRKFPATQIHAAQQLRSSYLPSIRSRCGYDYTEILGECLDFSPRTGPNRK